MKNCLLTIYQMRFLLVISPLSYLLFFSCSLPEVHINTCSADKKFYFQDLEVNEGYYSLDAIELNNEYIFAGYSTYGAILKQISGSGDLRKDWGDGSDNAGIFVETNEGKNARIFYIDNRIYWITDFQEGTNSIYFGVKIFEVLTTGDIFRTIEVQADSKEDTYLLDAIIGEDGNIIIAEQTDFGFALHRFDTGSGDIEQIPSASLYSTLDKGIFLKDPGNGSAYSLIGTSQDESSFKIFQFDPQWNLLDSVDIPRDNRISSFAAEDIGDGSILIAANEGDKDTGEDHKTTIFIYDFLNDQKEVIKEVPNVQFFDFEQSGNDLVAVGSNNSNAYFTKIDLKQKVLYSSSVYKEGCLLRIKTTTDGGFLMSGGLGHYTPILLKTDCNGNYN